jgi:tetratricopeptide (TPR) repeat protein
MGLLDRWRERGRTRDAMRLLSEGDSEALTAVNALSPRGRRNTLLSVARGWQDERAQDAQKLLSQIIEEHPRDREALELAAELQLEADDLDAAARSLEALCELAPGALAPVLELADVLIDADRTEDALRVLEPFSTRSEPMVLYRIGKALFASFQSDEAFEVLQEAVDLADGLSRSDPFGADLTAGDHHYAELRQLHEEVLAEVHGREAVVVDQAMRRRLDPRAGVNFKLLAASLMASRPQPPYSVELRSIAEERATGKALIKANREDPLGHILVGSSYLRDGDGSAAQAHFERAERYRPLHFAAPAGRGAALQLNQAGGLSSITKRLSDPGDAPLGWERVFPALPSLSRPERRVVAASTAPLRPFLPTLESAGASLRILSIDALVTDLQGFADAREQRAEDDHRSYDCITGMAYGKDAVVKVEEVLDISSEGGWTLAHELAHVVLELAPDDFAAEVEQLYNRFIETGFVGGAYQLSNVHEFFACSYVDFLRVYYGTPTYTVYDDLGLSQELFTFFRRLAGR